MANAAPNRVETGGSAFPTPSRTTINSPGVAGGPASLMTVNGVDGMTLRDYFAASALQGLVNLAGRNPAEETKLAYQYADAMLLARK